MEGSFLRWLPLLSEFDEAAFALLMGTTCWLHDEHWQVYVERSPEAKTHQHKWKGLEAQMDINELKFTENV